MTFMSSGHNPDHTKSIRRKKGDGSTIDVECPVSIVDYNQYMGGVDRGINTENNTTVQRNHVSHISIYFGLSLRFVFSMHLFLVITHLALTPYPLIYLIANI